MAGQHIRKRLDIIKESRKNRGITESASVAGGIFDPDADPTADWENVDSRNGFKRYANLAADESNPDKDVWVCDSCGSVDVDEESGACFNCGHGIDGDSEEDPFTESSQDESHEPDIGTGEYIRYRGGEGFVVGTDLTGYLVNIDGNAVIGDPGQIHVYPGEVEAIHDGENWKELKESVEAVTESARVEISNDGFEGVIYVSHEDRERVIDELRNSMFKDEWGEIDDKTIAVDLTGFRNSEPEDLFVELENIVKKAGVVLKEAYQPEELEGPFAVGARRGGGFLPAAESFLKGDDGKVKLYSTREKAQAKVDEMLANSRSLSVHYWVAKYHGDNGKLVEATIDKREALITLRIWCSDNTEKEAVSEALNSVMGGEDIDRIGIANTHPGSHAVDVSVRLGGDYADVGQIKEEVVQALRSKGIDIDEKFFESVYMKESEGSGAVDKIRVVNDEGRAFNVVVDPHVKEEYRSWGPTVKFYDATHEDDGRFEKGLGQFVSSYYLNTLMYGYKGDRNPEYPQGLVLDGGVPVWHVTAENMRDVLDFARKQAEKYNMVPVKEAKKRDTSGDVKVVWTDRGHKSHTKVFRNDPQGAPENARTRAQAYVDRMEAKDAKDKYGNIRSIKIVRFDESTERGKGLPADIEKLIARFPDDATDWWGTDEIRDIARASREAYTEFDLDMLLDEWDTNPDAPQPLDFRSIKKPSEWNTKAKQYIREMWNKMSDEARRHFVKYVRDFILGEDGNKAMVESSNGTDTCYICGEECSVDDPDWDESREAHKSCLGHEERENDWGVQGRGYTSDTLKESTGEYAQYVKEVEAKLKEKFPHLSDKQISDMAEIACFEDSEEE